jgi:hypothetical protein
VTMNALYYLGRDLTTDAPLAVYRFFADERQVPEVFSPKHGCWKPDGKVRQLRMSGELSDLDRITEQEASQVIASWGGQL